jgi:hypothetical protein
MNLVGCELEYVLLLAIPTNWISSSRSFQLYVLIVCFPMSIRDFRVLWKLKSYNFFNRRYHIHALLITEIYLGSYVNVSSLLEKMLQSVMLIH